MARVLLPHRRSVHRKLARSLHVLIDGRRYLRVFLWIHVRPCLRDVLLRHRYILTLKLRTDGLSRGGRYARQLNFMPAFDVDVSGRRLLRRKRDSWHARFVKPECTLPRNRIVDNTFHDIIPLRAVYWTLQFLLLHADNLLDLIARSDDLLLHVGVFAGGVKTSRIRKLVKLIRVDLCFRQQRTVLGISIPFVKKMRCVLIADLRPQIHYLIAGHAYEYVRV